MIYLIIESFKHGKVKELYAQFDAKGRQLPDGVQYINSWIDMELQTCYQVMSADHLSGIQKWTELWSDYAEFEIIPVLSSSEAQEKVNKLPH